MAATDYVPLKIVTSEAQRRALHRVAKERDTTAAHILRGFIATVTGVPDTIERPGRPGSS